MSFSGQTLAVRIAGVRPAAKDVVILEMRAGDGGELPAFTAGAHIDLHLSSGMIRSYSLMNDPAERHRYVVAVQKSAAGRGGSAHVHDALREGTALEISVPRNNFPLEESAAHTELIAGGIGITPIFSMIQRLEALGREWHLHYCARTREHAALYEQLQAYGDRVDFNFDQEPGGRMLDLPGVVAGSPAGTHFYCCGPLPMLAGFETAVSAVPEGFSHLEYFNAKEPDTAPALEKSYAVSLARTGHQFTVNPGESILDKLIELDFDITYSCREGVCGSCETRVLSGTPHHRDLVLTKAEKAAGKSLMVCCSGCKSDSLVLDL